MMRRTFVGVVLGIAVMAVHPAARADSAEERAARMRAALAGGNPCAWNGSPCGPAYGSAATRSSSARAARTEPRTLPDRAEPASSGSRGKWIEILLDRQELVAWEGDTPVMQTTVSTGARGTETPTGRFAIRSKERRHWSNRFDVWMPYAMRVVGGIYIHEVPLSAGGRRIGAASLGSPVSHGCIRVGVGAAERLYNWAPVGAPVLIR